MTKYLYVFGGGEFDYAAVGFEEQISESQRYTLWYLANEAKKTLLYENKVRDVYFYYRALELDEKTVDELQSTADYDDQKNSRYFKVYEDETVSSGNLLYDNEAFQKKFGFDIPEFDEAKLNFRNDLLTEEFNEMQDALKSKDAEEWVDAHIDLLVIALGNLYLAGVDIHQAWAEVFKANMSKERGIKPGREQSGGFDVIKPKNWKAPSHKGNHGKLTGIFNG